MYKFLKPLLKLVGYVGRGYVRTVKNRQEERSCTCTFYMWRGLKRK